jgi:23S rRNA pseudouridine2605 synthase
MREKSSYNKGKGRSENSRYSDKGRSKERSDSNRPSDKDSRRESKDGYKPAGKRSGSYSAKPDDRGHIRGDQKKEGRYQGGGRPFDKKKSFKPRYKDAPASPKASSDGKIRLNKFIANSGVCSRREADLLIKAGVVTVNGKIVNELGTKINPGDVVVYDGNKLTAEKKVYVLLNKPKDFITTSDDPQGRKTVMDLVKNAGDQRLYPVGRLDRNTTGLLLMTNDGELAKKLTHPRYGARKIYHVFLDKQLTRADMQKVAEGILIDGEKVIPDAVEYAGKNDDKSQIGIELHSGQNRVVRRIFESLDYKVLKLDRVVFAGLTKKDLPRGHWRYLTEKELNFLKMIK